jgi:hypothetical protein
MKTSLKNIGGMTSSQKQLLSKIEDPQQRALQQLQMEEQNKQLIATTISNILKTRADGQMNTASNIK